MRNRYYQIDWAQNFDSTSAVIERMRSPRRRKSENTIRNYLHGVKIFTEGFMQKDNPDECLESIQEDPRKYVDEYVDYLLKERKLAPKTIRGYFFGVKYWLQVNDVDVKPLEDIDLPSGTIVVTEDRAPTKEELRQILSFAHIREQALTQIAVSSGLRINTIATLTWKDVILNPNTLILEDQPENDPDMPALIKVKAKMGRKTGLGRRNFFTFITPEAKKTLLRYRQWRERKGETITPDSPIIGSLHGEGHINAKNLPIPPFGSPVLADNLQRAWIRLLKKSGLAKKSYKWYELHFHTLRKYFETQCINAGVKRPYIEFWLGHKGEYLDNSYFRANLQEHLTEYTKAIPHLSILETPKMTEEERRKRTILDVASMLFRDQPEKYEQIKNILAKARTMREIDDSLAQLEENRLKPIKLRRHLVRAKTNEQDHDCQRIISEAELESYLNDGWRYIATLPSGKIVVEK